MNGAEQSIQLLPLQQYPEGGWFREVYRARDPFLISARPAASPATVPFPRR